MARRRCLFASYFYVKYNGASYDGTLTIPSFDATGGTAEITVISYKPWNIRTALPSWITMSTQSGKRGSTVITITASPNPDSTQERDTTLTFMPNTEKYSFILKLSQNKVEEPYFFIGRSMATATGTACTVSCASANTQPDWDTVFGETVFFQTNMIETVAQATGVTLVWDSQYNEMFDSDGGNWVNTNVSIYRTDPDNVETSQFISTSCYNNDGEQRQGVILVKSGSTTLGQITVVQAASETKYFYWGNSGMETISGGTATSGQTTLTCAYRTNYNNLSSATTANWITSVTFTNGTTFTVRFAANDSTEQRTGTVTIKGDGTNVATFTVTQKAKAYFKWNDNNATAITADTISAAGGNASEAYLTNYTGLSVSPASTYAWMSNVGITNTAGNGSFSGTAGNNGGSSRDAIYNIKIGSTTVGTITVRQAAYSPTYSISVSPTSDSSESTATTSTTVTVVSVNQGWSFDANGTTITANPSTGNAGTTNVTLNIPAYNGARTVYFSGNTQNKASFEYTQSEAQTDDIWVSYDSSDMEYRFTATEESGSKDVYIKTTPEGLGWHLSENPAWVDVYPTAGTGDETVVVSWSDITTSNPEEEIRFVLDNGDDSDYVFIEHAGSETHSLVISIASEEIMVGDTTTLSIEYDGNPVSVSDVELSYDSTIISIGSDGTVTGLAAGNTNISGTYQGTSSNSISVQVNEEPVAHDYSIVLTPIGGTVLQSGVTETLYFNADLYDYGVFVCGVTSECTWTLDSGIAYARVGTGSEKGSVYLRSNPRTSETGQVRARLSSIDKYDTYPFTIEPYQEPSTSLSCITVTILSYPTIDCTGGTVSTGSVSYEVTAYYDDSGSGGIDVTSSASVTGTPSTGVSAESWGSTESDDERTAGTITIYASFTDGGVTKNSEDSVTIMQDPNPFVESGQTNVFCADTQSHNDEKTGDYYLSISCSPSEDTVSSAASSYSVVDVTAKMHTPTTAFTYDTYVLTTAYSGTLCTGREISWDEPDSQVSSGDTAATSVYTAETDTSFYVRQQDNTPWATYNVNGDSVTASCLSANNTNADRTVTYTFITGSGQKETGCTFEMTQKRYEAPPTTRTITIHFTDGLFKNDSADYKIVSMSCLIVDSSGEAVSSVEWNNHIHPLEKGQSLYYPTEFEEEGHTPTTWDYTFEVPQSFDDWEYFTITIDSIELSDGTSGRSFGPETFQIRITPSQDVYDFTLPDITWYNR